jgi:ABC-type sugar transport system substrate-binding protein
MSAPAIAPPMESIDQKVGRLIAQWDDETAYLSSTTQIEAHPAYRAIIALGKPALPALFRAMERTRNGHLDGAVGAITGVQPVPAESAGRMHAIADIWVNWAKENGYLQ